SGEAPHEIIARHAMDAVPRLAAARSDIPARLDAVVQKALAKVPADRFKTCEEFAAALELQPNAPSLLARKRSFQVAAIAALVVVLAVTAAWWSRLPIFFAAPRDHSLAV